MIIENKVFNDTEVISGLFEEGLTIRNCVFKEDLILEFLILGKQLFIIDCTFEESLTIRNISSAYELQESKARQLQARSIDIYKTTVKKVFNIFDSFLQNGITLKFSEISDCSFDSIRIEALGISINNIKCEKDFYIYNVKILSNTGIRLFKCNFSNVDLSSIGSSYLDIQRSIFDDNFQIWTSKIKSLRIFSSVFKKEILIHKVSSVRLILERNLFNERFTYEVNEEDGKIYKPDSIYIYLNTSESVIQFIGIKSSSGSRKKYINEEKILFKNVLLDSGINFKGMINFNGNFNIKVLFFSGVSYANEIILSNVTVRDLVMRNFYNYGKVILQKFDTDSDSILYFNSSYLGNTSFYTFDFSNFKEVEITDTVLFESSFYNCKWFDTRKLNIKDNKIHNDWEKDREVFQQLKLCMEKNKNRPKSLEFRAAELYAYDRSLLWFSKDFLNKLILRLNYISNLNGRNFLVGILFTLIVWIISFHLYYCCIYGFNIHFGDPRNLYIIDREFWHSALHFLWLPNSADEMRNLFNEKSIFWQGGMVFFILGKSLIAYGLFQIVSSFRKYVK